MSTTIPCPNGHALGFTPAMEGNKVRCPICQAIFEVPRSVPAAVLVEEYVAVESIPEAPLAPPPLPDDGLTAQPYLLRPERTVHRDRARDDWDDDFAPRKKKKRGTKRGQVQSLDIGLACYYWKFVVSVILILLFITSAVVSVIMQAGEDPRRPAPPAALMGILGFLSLLGLFGFGAVLILGIVGACFAVRVPPSYGARGLAIANLVLEGLPPVLYLFGVFTALASGEAMSGLALGVIFFLLAALGVLAGFVVFMIFLKALARYLKDRSTEGEAIEVMVLTLATVIGTPILLVLAVVALSKVPVLPKVVAFGIVLFAWIAMVKLLFRILAIISALRARLSY